VDALLKHRADHQSTYAWQDRASDAIAKLNEQTGKLIFNVASTGAGKTLGNLKLAMAARPRSCRIAVAFNLRSLTTQTFDAFAHHFERILGDHTALFHRDFSCLLGGEQIMRDHSHEDEDDIDSTEQIDLAGAISLDVPTWMKELAAGRNPSDSDEKLVKLLVSPVLISTIDWIVACGEPGQQDRHAKALIRVANSDLILDEVDSYDSKAAVAVMRIIRIAATFGRNVIISSASLSPELARGIFSAYEAGRRVYASMSSQTAPWAMSIVHDDSSFTTDTIINPDLTHADAFYRQTMKGLMKPVKSAPPTKRWRLSSVSTVENLKVAISDLADELHEQFCVTPAKLKCRISIGLVRVANVNPCMEIAEFLRSDINERFIVTAYHSRDVKDRRAFREKWMDRILDRRDDKWVDALTESCPWIKDFEGDLRLIVVATPVEEVGRDHDFDWAIIEPSSMHSIIQTAGRVNRHRRNKIPKGCFNIVVLSHNVRALKTPERECFVRPGLELLDKANNLATHPSHDAAELMKNEEGSEQEAMNAAMIFDHESNRTNFAIYDSNAVRIIMEKVAPILTRKSGYETGFMIQEFAKKYPLRSQEPGFRNFDLAINLKDDKFSIINNPENRIDQSAIKQGKREPNYAGKVILRRIPERTWLCADIDGSKEHRASLKIPEGKVLENIEILWTGINPLE
jgi:CRISPR-associated endonuclease/helicase Cas3